ncbi:MAG: type I restriction-modification system subunit M [archaeon]|nr:type I restriction-modification system subunit M [archaeon]
MTNSLGQDLWDIYENLKEDNRIGFLTDDEFQKYFLGFISYKYLSEKLEAFVNDKLKYENLNFEEAYKHDDYKKSLREESINEIGYFVRPDLLFKNILYSNNIGNLNEELEKAFNEISDSSIGTKSEEDFQNLFEGVDLNASQLGKEKTDKNKVIFNILEALGSVHFDLGKEGMDNRIFRKTILENSKFDKMDNEMSLLDNKVGDWSRKRQNEYYRINAKHNSIQKDYADLDRLVDAKMEPNLNEMKVEADYAYDMEESLSYKKEKDEKEIDNLIGSGFEYLLSKFSLNSSNSADFYTPNEVSTLIAALIASKKRHLDSVYDPCCGSASLLLEIHKTIPCDAIYGQEINASFYNIARENMILHNIHYKDFDIKQGDTLEQPQHLGESFEAVVSQIPFNSKWSADKSFRKDIRFSEYKFLAPRTKADYAFIQHMLYHLREKGIMIVVAPLGVLFRGSAEGKIRKIIVEKNYLDAVIGLPANMFFSTNNPACLMVFRKDRAKDEDILFIDASRDFKKSKLINRLTHKDIKNIVKTYSNRKEIDKYSHRASLEDIERNDFNLNIPRYVDAFEDKEEKIDPKELSNEHEKLLAEIDILNKEIEIVSKELNIKDIFYR